MTSTMDTTDLILKKIKSLPPLPLVVQKLIAVMENDLSSADDISEVISCDQALAGKVLKLVNSSFFGLSGQVGTISRAVVILGMGPLRNLAVGMSLAKLMSESSKGGVEESFWAHSIATAAAAEVLARESQYHDPEEAFIAGLLHDIGHLILKEALPELFAEVQEMGTADMVDNEKRVMGMPHTRAGQKLMKHWKLPPLLGQVARFHHTSKVVTGHDDPLVSLVTLADAMARACGGAYEHPLSDEDFLKLIKLNGIDLAETHTILDAVKKRIEETKLFLKIAMDGDIETGTPVEQTQLTCCVICTDKLKVHWLQEMLGYHGHKLIGMKDYFGSESHQGETDLVIVDPGSLTADQLAKIAPILSKASDRIVRLGEPASEALDQAAGCVVDFLPLVFSPDDLSAKI